MPSGSLRASCPDCGHVAVRGVEITIRCRVETMETVYRFRCPRCSRWSVSPAGPNVITLLLRNGARVEHWRHALELDEHPDESAAPLGEADLVRFLAFLDALPTASRDRLRSEDECTRE
jgi:hypothetical protein